LCDSDVLAHRPEDGISLGSRYIEIYTRTDVPVTGPAVTPETVYVS